jgi:hypothetical protein
MLENTLAKFPPAAADLEAFGLSEEDLGAAALALATAFATPLVLSVEAE